MSAVERLAAALGIDPTLIEDAVREIVEERETLARLSADPYYA